MQNQIFLTVRWIGMPYKLSSHKVNLVLLNNGLIDSNRLPTKKARGRYEPYQLQCGLTAYRWDRDFVHGLIEEHLKANPPAPKPKRRRKAKV